MAHILNSFKLEGKNALVTGGSDGIGKVIALALAQAGAKVCINGRNQDKLDFVKNEFANLGYEIFTIAFDVSDQQEITVSFETIKRFFGTIDILVNNAGIIKRSPILDMNNDDFRKVIDINLISAFMVSKSVVPEMIEKGGGKIINICSLMSEYGRNSVSAYAAAKGGLKMLTKNMCVEWGRHNIQVNGIGPGYIKTAKTKAYASKNHPFNKLIMMRTPANRWGEVEDLCGTALLLSSQAGDFINGQIIYVDGGITANFGYLEGENK
ncbi:gluconate 5-dehydrogenase [Zobellia galactanivorans]|uniref:gluconate 5-dehydrogenase n=1 Tax=Zobellia galactanivorans (strain DSM 12802 / CCUG 47099 / CIP 106680 / NCIMB 13871 / Dsij) TaxID=63186 RepID=UPI001C07BFED|nr:gluconate 5-dehydrogenase [Zobellia galactanivorans]MBU3028407.1 gluconate 5-dehydrogenase [Zobellia galactanivorans]